jgi:hypothetical protein
MRHLTSREIAAMNDDGRRRARRMGIETEMYPGIETLDSRQVAIVAALNRVRLQRTIKRMEEQLGESELLANRLLDQKQIPTAARQDCICTLEMVHRVRDLILDAHRAGRSRAGSQTGGKESVKRRKYFFEPDYRRLQARVAALRKIHPFMRLRKLFRIPNEEGYNVLEELNVSEKRAYAILRMKL